MKKWITKFKISSRKSKLYFSVYVYDNEHDLQKDASNFDKKAGKSDWNNDGVLGIVHPFERFTIEKNKEVRLPIIGIIRLLNNSGTEVASHEIMHAAIWQYRLLNKGNANFGKQNGEREENFAYMYGQLFRNLVTKMYKNKIWV